MDQPAKLTKNQESTEKDTNKKDESEDLLYPKKRRYPRPSTRNFDNYLFENSSRPIGTQTRNQNRQQAQEDKAAPSNTILEENESICCRCEGGGELVCCDTCIRAYHIVCLSEDCRPPNYTEASNDLIQWSCPICLYFHVHDDLDKRRGILLKLKYAFPVPEREFDPCLERTRTKSKETFEIKINKICVFPYSNNVSDDRDTQRFNHKDLFRETHHNYLFEDIRKEHSSQPAEDSNKRKAFEKKDLASATSQGCMNVGPSYQVPELPMSFLEVQDCKKDYQTLNDRYLAARLDSRVVYSATAWRRLAQKYKKSVPFDPPQKNELPSRSNLTMTFISSEETLQAFCQALLDKWSSRCLWPYSSEFAYKILYHYKFNGAAALNCFDDPTFNFFKVCDPPVKPYLNKWKPKDKRSYFPATPFPPPQHYRCIYGGLRNR